MEQNLDVADPWLSRCHDECPVPCCDMSQISVMTAGSWTTCYIFCYITISYTQQHGMSEAHLTHHYVYSLSNLLGRVLIGYFLFVCWNLATFCDRPNIYYLEHKHSTPWPLRLTGIWRNIVIGWKQWKLRNWKKTTDSTGQKCYRGKGRHCNPSHNISAQATERDETPETSQANIKILSRTPNCCSPPPRLVFCLYARSQYSFCYLLTAAVENYIFWAQAFKEGRNQGR